MINEMRKIRILAVEDDDVDHLMLQRALGACDFNARLERATTVAQAKDFLAKSNFDCILLDYRLPDGSGLDLLCSSEFKVKSENIAVVMLTGEDDVSIAVKAMKTGAHDYLPKKMVGAAALEVIICKALETIDLERQVRESQQRIEELAFFDTLTGLPNRHVFEDRADQMIRVAKRKDFTFMIGVLDLDGFKAINDNLGHQAGDQVLQSVACRLAATIRDSDTVARFGGDEFVLLLPKAEPSYGAEGFSMRILEAVTAPIKVAGEIITVGVSIGLSQYPIHGSDREALIKRADEAMYQAKTGGMGWKLADS